jgi:hypothetical protein
MYSDRSCNSGMFKIELKCYRFELNFLLRVFKLFWDVSRRQWWAYSIFRHSGLFGVAWSISTSLMADGPWYVRRGLVAAWVQCYPVGRSRWVSSFIFDMAGCKTQVCSSWTEVLTLRSGYGMKLFAFEAVLHELAFWSGCSILWYSGFCSLINQHQ